MSDADRVAYVDLLKRAVNGYLQLGGRTPRAEYFVDDAPRYRDGDWQVPREAVPHSVLHADQLDLLERLALDVDRRAVDGAFVEAGVWRGGAVIFLLGLVRAYGMARTVWAADTFAGIPRNRAISGDPVDLWPDRWVADREDFEATVARYGVSASGLRVLAGALPGSLDGAGGPDSIALLRVDVDSYDSTLATLTALYPRVSEGGVVLIDDWHLPGAMAAVLEFLRAQRLAPPVHEEAMNAWWVKHDDPPT
jgi:O-methyltransferase